MRKAHEGEKVICPHKPEDNKPLCIHRAALQLSKHLYTLGRLSADMDSVTIQKANQEMGRIMGMIGEALKVECCGGRETK